MHIPNNTTHQRPHCHYEILQNGESDKLKTLKIVAIGIIIQLCIHHSYALKFSRRVDGKLVQLITHFQGDIFLISVLFGD